MGNDMGSLRKQMDVDLIGLGIESVQLGKKSHLNACKCNESIHFIARRQFTKKMGAKVKQRRQQTRDIQQM